MIDERSHKCAHVNMYTYIYHTLECIHIYAMHVCTYTRAHTHTEELVFVKLAEV